MTLPTVIMTVSKADEDILKSYGLRTNCYETGPVDFKQFMKVVKTIEYF